VEHNITYPCYIRTVPYTQLYNNRPHITVNCTHLRTRWVKRLDN